MSTLSKVDPRFETRPATCPGLDCGAQSIATRVVTDASDATKPWTRHLCERCGAAASGRAVDDAVSREEDARTARVRTNLSALDVPPLYADATLETFELVGDPENRAKQNRMLQLARRYLVAWPDVPMITVFLGSFGSGKGHIAWSLARTLVTDDGASARVCVLSDAIRDLREAWGGRDDGGLSEAQRLAKYRAPDLLVIDEVSRHAFYGQPQQHLYDLVAWRELRLKPTILTTNETGGELAEFLGPALSSRALGWGQPWNFGDVDFRLLRGQPVRKVGT